MTDPQAVVGPFKRMGRTLTVHDSNRRLAATLRAATLASADDPDVPARLSEWRNRHSDMFLTQYQTTPDRTARWLREVIFPDNARIVFLIHDMDDRLVGHYALAGIRGTSASLDYGVLGVRGGAPGLFEWVQRRVLRWCFQDLGVAQVSAQVLSHNIPALWLHRRSGLRVLRRDPLAKDEAQELVTYRVKKECEEADVPFDLVTLGLDAGQFDATEQARDE